METVSKLGRILIVEDDPKDVELTALEEFNLANEIVVVQDGEEALDYLYYRGQFQSRSTANPAFNPGEDTWFPRKVEELR